MKKRRLYLAGLAGIPILYLFSSAHGPRDSGTVPQSTYVWQRVWTEQVGVALRQHANSFDRIVVLAAEIKWHGDQPSVARANPNYATLRDSGRPVGLALRIGGFRGDFPGSVEFLANTAKAEVTAASENGVNAKELQIDFDCPESKLADYCVWIRAIRQRIAPVPVTITALPCWLKQKDFRQLLALVPEYVLQVHALQRPKTIHDTITLCDTRQVRQWVEQAAQLAVPFRLALPTYTYRLGYDACGNFAGLFAEGAAASWPKDFTVRELAANPGDIASIVHDLTTDRPTSLSGIIWYRLPVQSDEYNWSWSTLCFVMAGQAPKPHTIVSTQPVEGGFEVSLENQGSARLDSALSISVRWPHGELSACDAIAGFELRRSGDQGCQLSGRARLSPGGRQVIAWLRFKSDSEICVHVDQE